MYRPPLGYRIFSGIVNSSKAAREEECGWAARLVRRSVVTAVRLLQRAQSMDFPARAKGGWYWIWRWRFEILMRWCEWESLLWVDRLLKPGMVVLDLGAHIGYYTRAFSRLVGPRGKVFAFEPNPENVGVLRRNLSGRRYANVEVLPYAASDRHETARLFISAGHSNHSLIEGFTASEAELPVETVSVDEFLKERGISSIDFAKIDIEGSEPRALAGMQQTIHNSPHLVLLMECNPLALEKAGFSVRQFLCFIESLGLKPRAILEDGRLGPVPESTQKGDFVNLLCVKADAAVESAA